MRPIFFGATIDPPVMDVLIPAESLDTSYHIVRGIRIRTPVSTLAEANAAGIREVRAFTPTEIELLRDVAVPIDRSEVTNDRPPTFSVDVVEQLAEYTGPIFCPACCRKLGAGDSPTLGYLRACPGCHRPIDIRIVDGELVVLMRVAD